MKKIGWMALLGLLALACSLSDLQSFIPVNPTSTPLQTPSTTSSPSETPTDTATQPTPTFTSTPTPINFHPTQTSETFSSQTGTPGTSNPDVPFLVPGSVGFNSVQLSSNVLRLGSCEPASVKFTVYVTDPVREKTVLLFLRLKDTASDATTDWGYGAEMESNVRGVFTYTVTAKSVPGRSDFSTAYVQYQLVAFDSQKNEVGRTKPALNSLSIGPCP